MLFHNRKLLDKSQKNEYNAWDNEEISGELLDHAIQKVHNDNLHIFKNKMLYQSINSKKSWELFYSAHLKFFRDRKWIIQEFDGVLEGKKILEMGCGVGNSLHWFFEINKRIKNESDIIQMIKDEKFQSNLNVKVQNLPFDISGCDFSENAIKICKSKYSGNFFTHDISSSDFLSGEYDTILLIFTLSAIDPQFHEKVLEKAYIALKPNGKLYFKDFAFLDMVQLRYQPDKILSRNFYVRSDGTLTYFFEEEYFRSIKGKFKIIDIKIDKRLLVNRKRKLDMYRVFLQVILQK